LFSHLDLFSHLGFLGRLGLNLNVAGVGVRRRTSFDFDISSAFSHLLKKCFFARHVRLSV
jgi:hypothetical protein